VVGRALDPGRPDEVLAPEEQAGALRAAEALAAAVADEVGPGLEVDVRDGEDLGGGVDEDRNAPGPRPHADGAGVERALVDPGTGEDVHHGRAGAEGGLQLGHGRNIDDPHPRRTHRRVVDVAGVPRDDDLVPRKAPQIGQAHVEVGVAPGEAGGGGVLERRRAAGGDDPPLRPGQLGQALPDALGQLVEVDVVPGRGLHGLAHLGEHERAAEDGVGPAGVDDRAHADRLVDARTDLEAGGRTRRRGHGRLGRALTAKHGG
jgi:hypothetical protein